MITLKKSLSKWLAVDTDDEVQFLIEYPSIKQGEHLDELRYDAFGKYANFEGDFKIDLAKFLKFKRYFLKYTIKGWKGVDEDCQIIDNELEDNQWQALTRSEERVNKLYELIYPEVDFNQDDKKKLDSVNISSTKG
jgi:hypothetical protein